MAIKRILSVLILISIFASVFALTSCQIYLDIFKSKLERTIDKVLLEENYSIECITPYGTNVILVDEGNVHITRKVNQEDDSTKTYVSYWTHDDGKYIGYEEVDEDGIIKDNKYTYTKQEYVAKYTEVVASYSPIDVLFSVRNCLSMAQETENGYKYVVKTDSSITTHYVEVDGKDLIVKTVVTVNREDTVYTYRFYDIGKTEIDN